MDTVTEEFVFELLQPYSHDWHRIGTEMGLDSHHLIRVSRYSIVGITEYQNSESRLRAVIREWFKNNSISKATLIHLLQKLGYKDEIRNLETDNLKASRNQPRLYNVYPLLRDKSDQWDDIGRVLGVDFKYRQMLHSKPLLFSTLESVITKWIESDTSTPVTWDGLINALKYLDFDDVIETIRARYLSPETNHETTPGDDEKPNYALYLDRAAAKGTVTTRISNLGLLGAAGTGKTSMKRLLTGQEPVYVHDSTPVLKPEEYYKEDTAITDNVSVDPSDEDDDNFDWDSDREESPVEDQTKAKPQMVPSAKLDIAIASAGNIWSLATEDTLLMRLANCVEIVAEQERCLGDVTVAGPRVDAGKPLLDGFSMEKRSNPILIATNQESELIHMHSSTEAVSTSAVSHASSQYDEVTKLILDFVTPENLKKLGITHFVSISDTGGQAAFLDVAPALLRFNSVNLILLKLNERLEDPAQFFYSVNGVKVGDETRQIPTRSLVRSFVSSKSKIQKPRIKGIKIAKPHQKPMFMILGTHFDKYKEEMASPNATCQTKEEKNKSLKNDLSPFESSIYSNRNKMLFSLDTRKRDKDTLKLASMIRKLVLANYTEAEIPLSWYIFQLAMNKIKMDDKNEGMILLSTLTTIGAVSKIPADEVEAALEYFHDLQVCMFYPSVVPNVVFTDPQYLLDRISEIIAFSYGSGKIGMAKEEFENFTKYGRFKISLLESVCKQFKEYFSQKDFLALMGHLFIISSLPDTDEYFMPCVLAEHPNPCEGFMDSSTQVEPLLLTWPDKCAPNGLFPSLSTNIQSRQGFNNIHFKMSCGVKQYRNRITLDCRDLGCEVVLIECDSFFGIAVHSMCLQPDSCVKIRGAIFSCLGTIVKRFGWLPSLAFPEKVFICKIRPECKDRIHFCYSSISLKVISCENRSSSAMKQKDSHSIWWGKSEYQLNHSNGLTTLNLFRLLQDKSSKWDDIGRELNISKNFRTTLDHDRSKTDDARLEAILEKWLEENLPECTWSDFRKILTDNLKYNDVADQISTDIY